MHNCPSYIYVHILHSFIIQYLTQQQLLCELSVVGANDSNTTSRYENSINIMVTKLCVFSIYIWNGSDNVWQWEEFYQQYLLSKLVILFTKY